MSTKTIRLPKLTPWQHEVFESVSSLYTRDAVLKPQYAQKSSHFIVKSARQRGKSYLIQVLCLWIAIFKPGSESYVIEPTNSQCRRVFKNLKKALSKTGLLYSANASTQELTFKNGSSIILRTGEAPDTIRGGTVTGLLIFDEAAFLTDECIEVSLPMVNVHRAPVLMFSTPLFADGAFYHEYIKQSSQYNKSFDWTSSRFDYSAFISEEQILEYKSSYTPFRFMTEIEGQFIKEHSFVFGDFYSCIKLPDSYDVKYMGIDWGTGSQGDSTVIACMNLKAQMNYLYSTNTLEPAEQIKWIASLINKHHPRRVRVEYNSIGSVYYSLLRKEIIHKDIIIDPFTTTNESKRKIIEQLISAFAKSSLTILDDPLLKKQLSAFEMKKLKSGYTYGNFNDSIHDDFVMALAFCYSLIADLEDPRYLSPSIGTHSRLSITRR